MHEQCVPGCLSSSPAQEPGNKAKGWYEKPEIVPPDRKQPNKPEMESLQGERTVFYAHLYKKAEERAIQR